MCMVLSLIPSDFCDFHKVPLSIWFPKQEYWSELPFPSPGDQTHHVFLSCIPSCIPVPSRREHSFPMQGSNQGLLHCKWSPTLSQILYRLSQQGNPELENKSIEIIQTKHKEKKEWAKMEQNIHSTWKKIMQYNIHVVWIPEGKDREFDRGKHFKISEKIMVEKFLKLMTCQTADAQIQRIASRKIPED